MVIIIFITIIAIIKNNMKSRVNNDAYGNT